MTKQQLVDQAMVHTREKEKQQRALQRSGNAPFNRITNPFHSQSFIQGVQWAFDVMDAEKKANGQDNI